MSDTGAEFLVIIDGTRVVGVLSEKDALRLMVLHPGSIELPIGVTDYGAFVLSSPTLGVTAATLLLEKNKVSYLVLINESGVMQGVVSSAHLQLAARIRAATATLVPGTSMELFRDGIVILDAHNLKVAEVNEAFASMLGLSRKDIVGQFPWFLDARFSKGEIETLAAEHLASRHGVVSYVETKMRRNDGKICEMEISSVLIDSGGISQYLCICRDITARKLAEQNLREREELYSAIVNLAPVGVAVVDAETLGFVEFNNIACEMLGFSREEFACLTIQDINAEMNGDDLERIKKKILEHGHWIFDTVHRHKDGSLRNVRVSVSANEIHERMCLISIWTDISEQLKLEEQLVHARKMEAVGQLAGGVAHDFNNNLTAIVGFAHLLEMKLENHDSLVKYVRHILQAAERAAALTGDLLTFSRKRVLDLRQLRLNEVLVRTKKLLVRLIRADIKLDVSCCDSELMVLADEAQLVQILMNLTTNARDAMPEGGKITISTDSIKIDQQYVNSQGHGKPGRYALITFADSGCGMSEETCRKIFEPFFTTKGLGKGTGLGLATVYGMVNQLGGFIVVSSEQGKGTDFSIFLPELQCADTSADITEEVSSLQGGSEIILLAEDDSVVREMLSSLLMEAGYGVFVAENGAVAMEIFLEKRELLDLMILDVVMPEKNGIEVLRESLEWKTGVKAILMSGYTSENSDTIDYVKNGGRYIQKPVNPSQFLGAVREVLDSPVLQGSLSPGSSST